MTNLYYGTVTNLRARQAITDAFFTVLKEKHFSHITITDIITQAGVARSTYYHNFYNKEEIINAYMNSIYKKLLVSENIKNDKSLPQMINSEKLFRGIETSFSLLLKDRERILLIYNNGFGNMIQKMLNQHAQKIFANLAQKDHYRIYFIAGAMQNVLLEWLESGMSESPTEMAHILIGLLQNNSLWE